ncbi:MAG: antibiotic biosynthesis monooxygenase [Fluviicola sp.]|nr:MAG: antibiotic biosynthesis monooxygenase [Fluviicola sp.]
MITRIVQLEFEKDKIQGFLEFFDTIKHQVNTFPGCHGMKLYQDINRPTIVMTYSHWENQEALDAYRNSKTFGTIWPKIKPWFSEKPQAWSVNAYFDGFAVK